MCYQSFNYLLNSLLFAQIIINTFGPTFLPDIRPEMAARIIQQHEEIGWPGLLGSLDCSHWQWAKCPKSWQGDFKKGGTERPTVVYEIACDADLFIFHCNFAAPGANNDINVLFAPLLASLSPRLHRRPPPPHPTPLTPSLSLGVIILLQLYHSKRLLRRY